MADPQQALLNQLAKIAQTTGRSLADLATLARASGFTQHGELRAHLKATLGLGAGDANTLTHHVLGVSQVGAPPLAGDAVLDAIYTGPKAALRPIHAALMQQINSFGPFETAPKQGYVSLRRKKQFAMLGPATNSRFELGLNMKGLPGTDRLLVQPPGGMCPYKVKLVVGDAVDAELIGWIRIAYDAAG